MTKPEEGTQEEGSQKSEEVLETEREKNLKAENVRKAQEIQKLREELDAKREFVKESVFNPQDINTWKDHELKAVLKDPQYVAMHDQATELLERRRFQRFQAEREESTLRMNTELERQQKYPETLDPANPMAVRMNQLMHENHLDRTPAGRFVAARLASLEAQQAKSVAAGRKLEKDRQADVNANFSGEAPRPAPKASDVAKAQELKKRAMAGDVKAQTEWFKLRGLI